MYKIKLGIIEDDIELLDSMSEYFQHTDEVELVAKSNSVEEFLDHSPAVVPDVLLLDIMLPGLSGIEGIPLIKSKYPQINIVVVSVLDDGGSVFTSLKRGASGYVTKDTSLVQIKDALLNAFNGMSVMNQEIANKVLDFFKTNNDIEEKLSKKELIIAEALKLGMSYKMIAFNNNVTIDAIRFHVRNIYRKLEINSKGELISLMLRRGN